jgi:hypothetical protein
MERLWRLQMSDKQMIEERGAEQSMFVQTAQGSVLLSGEHSG